MGCIFYLLGLQAPCELEKTSWTIGKSDVHKLEVVTNWLFAENDGRNRIAGTGNLRQILISSNTIRSPAIRAGRALSKICCALYSRASGFVKTVREVAERSRGAHAPSHVVSGALAGNWGGMA